MYLKRINNHVFKVVFTSDNQKPVDMALLLRDGQNLTLVDTNFYDIRLKVDLKRSLAEGVIKLNSISIDRVIKKASNFVKLFDEVGVIQ